MAQEFFAKFGHDGVLREALRLEVSSKWKNESGRTVKDRGYHSVLLYGKLVTTSEKYLKEGDYVFVRGVGRFQSFEYLSDTGRLQRGVELVASELILLCRDDLSIWEERSDDAAIDVFEDVEISDL